MLKKIILTLGAGAAALGVSCAAFAHGGHGWGQAKHRHPIVHRPIVVVPAPRVVYAPPPRVAYPYYAAPVYRAARLRPAPVYSAPGLSIRFDFPL